jgi:hypothetical protein
VTDLRGHSAALDTALDEIELACWIIRQSLDQQSAQAAALPRLAHAQQYLAATAPGDAPLLRSARELIEKSLADEECMHERLKQLLACCEKHLTLSTPLRTVVLVRSAQEVECLRQAIKERWNTSDAELLSLGLEVRCAWSEPQPCDLLIESSYFGSRTLDLIFWSGARQATLLLDAVEARAAAFHVARMRNLLRRSSSTHAQTLDVFATLAPAFETMMARTPESLVHISFPSFLQKPISEQLIHLEMQLRAGASQDQVLVSFTGGSTLLCAPTQKIDLLEVEGAGRLLQRAARDLEPGDELLIIERETHAYFSERLMRLLDETVLHADYAGRNTWLTIVASTAQGRSLKQLQSALCAHGLRVNYATVRSWIPRIDDLQAGTVPTHWHAFKVLADVLRIALPEALLQTYYQHARNWRVQHRIYGRILTRMMRHAAFGQLDTETLQSVEKQWGWGVRDLLQATRRCTVDDLVYIAADIPLPHVG